MESLASMRAWLLSNRELCVEALRIYLGFGLFLKGMSFVFSAQGVAAYYQESLNLPFVSYVMVHFIGLVHICGGLLLCIGLLTRTAALFQMPVLFAAVMLVHLPEGLFSLESTLEFDLLVLFLLTFFLIYGSGKISVDYALEKRRKQLSDYGVK